MTDPTEIRPTAACLEVEEDLPNAARALQAGEEVAQRYPELARHLETCERCGAILAELVKEPDVQGERALRLDPEALFEGYLTSALSDSDAIARASAAERLGRAARIGPIALAALAGLAREDPEQEVRAAAIQALDELDSSVALPRRLIEAWAEAPEEATPFIEGVLAYLAAEGPPVSRIEVVEVTERVAADQDRVRLEIEGLPEAFEEKAPVIAAPGAPLERARRPVTAGRLEAPMTAARSRVFLIND